MSFLGRSAQAAQLNGTPYEFRGEQLVDGGFLESIPYHSALREGATHVLVLRSRDAGYRQPTYRRFAELALRLASPELVQLLRARPARYNREAEDLEALASCPRGRPLVSQVTVPRERQLVEHLDTEVPRIQECIRLGASAVASLVFPTGPGQLECAA